MVVLFSTWPETGTSLPSSTTRARIRLPMLASSLCTDCSDEKPGAAMMVGTSAQVVSACTPSFWPDVTSTPPITLFSVSAGVKPSSTTTT